MFAVDLTVRLGEKNISIWAVVLTLKAPITTAADDRLCNIFPNFQKKSGMIYLPAVYSHEISCLIAFCGSIGGALWVNNKKEGTSYVSYLLNCKGVQEVSQGQPSECLGEGQFKNSSGRLQGIKIEMGFP